MKSTGANVISARELEREETELVCGGLSQTAPRRRLLSYLVAALEGAGRDRHGATTTESGDIMDLLETRSPGHQHVL